MSQTDYGELFCQAVDTIVKERLNSIAFDQTILCTIIDDTLRASGIYTVSANGGTTKFEAYSSNTSYRNRNNVYVQIPGGDWNQQKIIISKKTDTTIEPYVYQKPFSTLIDITGNMIHGAIDSNTTGLIANAFTADLSGGESDPLEAVTLWTYNIDNNNSLKSDNGEDLAGYTRLGIQAGFQSWLNPFYVTTYNEDGTINEELSSTTRQVNQGEYGLRLRIVVIDDNTSKSVYDDKGNQIEPGFVETPVVYELYLNQTDMNGNPYNFDSFFSQEKVFDISGIGKIRQMQLQFYQKAGSFKDQNNTELPFTNFLNQLIKPNLYVNDIYLTLGYDINSIEEEMVQIYTLNPSTYSRTAEPLSTNHKEIQLRWIHKQADGTFKSITEKDDIDFEVRWYRFALGHRSVDDYAGVYWKYLSKQFTESKDSTYEVLDEEWTTYNLVYPQDQRKPGFFSTWSIPDTTLQEEQIKAIIIYNGKPYRSNTLLFTNEDEVVSKPTVDAVQALSVLCEDNTYGNYRIYNQGNSLIDRAQGQQVRTWCPYFKSAMDAAQTAPTELIEAESIEWIIPITNTMIVLDEAFKSGGVVDEQNDPGRIHITRYGVGIRHNDISEINRQKYRIADYYSPDRSNNTIQCKIVKEKITYTTTKELVFGPAGTTGTDCTFILNFDSGNTAVTLNSDNPTIVTARLYDYENNEVALDGYDIEWSWKTSNENIAGNMKPSLITRKEYKDANGNIVKYKQELQAVNSAINGENYYILQAKLKNWGDYVLEAYLPIPVRTTPDYHYISGATQIIYDTSGELLDIYKNPFKAYSQNGEVLNNIDWSSGKSVPGWTNYTYALNGISGEEAYTPKIRNTNGSYTLIPTNIYIDKACEYICVTGKVNGSIIWSQPILIMQNKYPQAMINAWDGSLTIDEDKNAILAAKIAAGRKESDDNTFSGVMIGDWGSESSLLNRGETGIWGYHHGIQSFGFKDDGTAFIGKPGKGRLLFDGDSSYLASQEYISSDGQNGLMLDFDDGYLIMSNGDNNIILDSDTGDGQPAGSSKPLKIGTRFTVDWDGTVTSDWGKFNNITVDGGTLTVGDNFSVTDQGVLTSLYGIFKYADIDTADIDFGSIYDADIDQCTITKGTLGGINVGNGYIYTVIPTKTDSWKDSPDGFYIGSPEGASSFASDGYVLVIDFVDAFGANIAGWDFYGSSGGGSLDGHAHPISAGAATFSKLTVNGENIGESVNKLQKDFNTLAAAYGITL